MSILVTNSTVFIGAALKKCHYLLMSDRDLRVGFVHSGRVLATLKFGLDAVIKK